MTLKLHTENIPGNLHQAATVINKWGWAEYVIALDFANNHTIAVFKMPATKVHEIRAASNFSDPFHDDYDGPVDPHLSDYRLSQVLANVEHHNQEAEVKKDAVPASTDQPAEDAKPTRKKPQPKSDQVKQATAAQANAESAGEGAQVSHAETGATNAAGAADRAQSSNMPDWAK